MESSQFTQLVDYLGNQNVKVKNEALQIILQLTGTKDNRETLLKTEIIKHLLRCVPEEVSQCVIIVNSFEELKPKCSCYSP